MLLIASFSATAQGSDFQCTPTDLGLIPFAAPCGSATGFTTGASVTQSGTTIGATTDSISGVILSCHPGPPLHDVWYSFVASETHVQIQIQGIGATPLNNSYVAIYEALEGECAGLIPRQCSVGTGTHTMEFGPLTFGVRYYLQIASNTPPTGDGNFNITINSKAICADCSKNSVLNAYPLPVKAAYPPDTTVGFCYSVIGYNELYGNRLHGVVPQLGNGWDVTTLTPYSAADSADFLGQWKWFNNLNIGGTSGIVSGFFYDVGGDNDPRNNLGDNGTFTTVWTFCFTVKTKPASACTAGQRDLSIRFLNYGDGESGSLIAPYDCSADQDYVFDAHMDCCPKPWAVIPQAAGCNHTPDGSILAYAGFSLFGYQYTLYNSAGVAVASYNGPPGSTSPHTFGGLLEGNYYLLTSENTGGACVTAVNTFVPGPVDYDIKQVSFGCPGASVCSNTAAVVVNSGAVASISWSNGDSGFFADSLCTGWTYVTIVDTGVVACSITDSIYIVNLPAGSPYFSYGSFHYCTSDSVAVVTDFPTASGGTFQIMTQPAGMTASDINPSTGTLDLTGATFAGYVIVRYTGPPPCNYIAADTIYLDVSPPPPSASSFPNQNLCIGDVAASYSNPSSTNSVLWYSDTTLTTLINTQAPGTSYDYFGGAPQTVGGTYVFYLVDVNSTSPCKSKVLPVVITVYPNPVIDAGPSITVCPGYGVNLNCSGANSFVWSPGSNLDNPTAPSPIATLSTTTLFTVVGTDATSGCSSTDTVTVYVDENGNCDVITYNGFTPNGDSHNDYWHIDGISVDPKNDVRIFNRWGDKIWETVGYDNVSNRWEGKTMQGKDAPSGTYYFVLHFKGTPHSGYVELTR
ncbi:MAG: gliding motility-associated C-terminal domain-containing protein [Bacteroidia bacterium]